MLDLTVLARAQLETEPFLWCRLNHLIPPAAASELARSFPTGGFRELTREGGSNKTYKMAKRPLLPIGADGPYHPEQLSDVWLALVESARSAEYRAALGALLGVQLEGSLLELNINRYGADCFVSPHTDHAQKIVTQLVYFNTVWDAAWGGCLRILRSGHAGAVVAEIPPTADTSIVLVRSDDAWHDVSPVRATSPQPRLTLELEFWREPPRASGGLRSSNAGSPS